MEDDIGRYLNERNDFQETKAWYKIADIFLAKSDRTVA
jgi:hypothetical protein